MLLAAATARADVQATVTSLQARRAAARCNYVTLAAKASPRSSPSRPSGARAARYARAIAWLKPDPPLPQAGFNEVGDVLIGGKMLLNGAPPERARHRFVW